MAATQTGKILNGAWVTVTKTVLVFLAVVVVPIIGWGIRLELRLHEVERHAEEMATDRLSGQMFSDIQQILSEQNPEMRWLSLRQIREVQSRNPPYINRR